VAVEKAAKALRPPKRNPEGSLAHPRKKLAQPRHPGGGGRQATGPAARSFHPGGRVPAARGQHLRRERIEAFRRPPLQLLRVVVHGWIIQDVLFLLLSPLHLHGGFVRRVGLDDDCMRRFGTFPI
jgi:hypothetical protein